MNIKKLSAIIMSTCILSTPLHAMKSDLEDDFSRFRKNSIFEKYSKCNLTDMKLYKYKEDGIYINFIPNICYVLFIENHSYGESLAHVTDSTINSLIAYINSCKFDGTFRNIIEILHLTIECILSRTGIELKRFDDLGFDFDLLMDPNDDGYGIHGIFTTFDRFKNCMVDRLQKLL